MKLLLGDALSRIDPDALPAIQGLQIPWINATLEEFFAEGKWARTTTKWKGLSTGVSFQINQDCHGQPFFTLPRGLLSLVAGAYGQQRNQPRGDYRVRFSSSPINGLWHQFGNGNAGVGDEAMGRGIQDLGDGFTCFQDILEPSYLRVITETAETNPTNVLFRGVDQNGNEIFSGSGSGTSIGVSLNVGASTTTQTTQIFGASPSIVQKPVTFGPLNLYAVSVATGVATLISIFAPADTSPGFRRYALGGLYQQRGSQQIPYTTVHAIAKRRFVPVVALSDEVIPGMVTAIEKGLFGRRYDLQGDIEKANSYWENAIHLLNSELSEYNGAAVPKIIFERGTNLAGGTFIN